MRDFITYNRKKDCRACGQLKNPLDELYSRLLLTKQEQKNYKLMCETLGIQAYVNE